MAANAEEAKSAYSRRDLAARYTIALREGRECRVWLRLIQIDQPGASKTVAPMLEECGELIGILTATVKKLRNVK